MSTSIEIVEALAVEVSCTDDELSVVLSDGRTVKVPVAWFPRLVHASARQRADWELIGGGIGVHWEAIDEDISIASLLQPAHFMRLRDPALLPTSRARRKRKQKPRSRAARG